MLTKYKRTSKKTGNFSRRTRTINANGRVTESFSYKTPGKNGVRRTVSTNNKSGAVKTTITSFSSNGWTQVRTNTTNTQSKKSNGNSVKFLSPSETGALAILLLVVIIICFIVYYFYWIIVASVWALVFYTVCKVFDKHQKRLDDEHNSRIFYEPYINKDD